MNIQLMKENQANTMFITPVEYYMCVCVCVYISILVFVFGTVFD